MLLGKLLLLIVLALGTRYLALRVLSIVKPKGRLNTIVLSVAGAWAGSTLLNWTGLGLRLLSVNLPGAVAGAALALFAAGLWPYVKILAGKDRGP